MSEPVTCAWCGAVAESDPPLGWSTSRERDGVLRHYCAKCSRDNVRGMEGRLDSEWWA